jgi:uncharacterized membrane protein
VEHIFIAAIKTIFFSMLPVFELRGSIPYALVLGFNPATAFALAFIGSLLPVPFIFFGVRPIFKWLRRKPFFERFISKVKTKAQVDGRKVLRYGFWGLILLVAIPLPGTGVWSGTVAASFLDIRFKKALPAIVIGNVIAGILVLFFLHCVF